MPDLTHIETDPIRVAARWVDPDRPELSTEGDWVTCRECRAMVAFHGRKDCPYCGASFRR
jgi:hypothetical protein